MDWTSPLKKPKSKKPDELALFKTPKPKISIGSTRSILDTHNDVGIEVARWVERWITQLVRERSLPPQLISSDFLAVLGKFLRAEDALEILTNIRNDYKREFPLSQSNAVLFDFNMEDLPSIVERDEAAKELMEAQRKTEA